MVGWALRPTWLVFDLLNVCLSYSGHAKLSMLPIGVAKINEAPEMWYHFSWYATS